jgi:ubiquinone/menaquinone biosynthesis C-methylase UbiE
MEKIRKPFQGITNIVRFNWHFFALSLAAVLLLSILSIYTASSLRIYLLISVFIIVGTTLISLSVSYYVYDWSDLYQLKWLDTLNISENGRAININAGFDETSHLIKEKYKNIELIVLDFYDPLKHTEISIKRARESYPSYPNTISVETTTLPIPDKSVDSLFVIFAAHEIRNELERVLFFKELHRIIKPNGSIIITEHLRDTANFFAYTIGFFHFYGKAAWRRTFTSANLQITKEIKLTPFISTFILHPHGNPL